MKPAPFVIPSDANAILVIALSVPTALRYFPVRCPPAWACVAPSSTWRRDPERDCRIARRRPFFRPLPRRKHRRCAAIIPRRWQQVLGQVAPPAKSPRLHSPPSTQESRAVSDMRQGGPAVREIRSSTSGPVDAGHDRPKSHAQKGMCDALPVPEPGQRVDCVNRCKN